MAESSRYILGIDLGTTNCVVAYIDATKKDKAARILSLPQFNKHGMLASFDSLPSFLHLGEGGTKAGLYARDAAADFPTRVVHSAKSWLSTSSSARREKILPIEAQEENMRVSALEATAAYLAHIREAWDVKFAQKGADYSFNQQQIIITVPASFDEVARTLTSDAAKIAQISNFTLLEEPSAAFYNWLRENEKAASSFFKEGDKILVCDVGGGTTDFSLIGVSISKGETVFHRASVGPHLLLGGDNMDNALCHYLESKSQREFDNEQWQKVRHLARSAKEDLLSGKSSSYHVWIPGKGSKIVQGGLGIELASQEVQNLILEGFFGLYDFASASDIQRKKALRSMGLNYESEPSITKHLANFFRSCIFPKKSSQQQQTDLQDSAEDFSKTKPQYILFNGQALLPQIFQNRLVDSIDKWFGGDNIVPLINKTLDLAVAKGAAYFGLAKRGLAIKIGGGSARSYYLKVFVEKDNEPRALTLLPRGALEGTSYVSEHIFSLKANTPVSFDLLQSRIRLQDESGNFIPISEEEMSQLSPIYTVLKYGNEKNLSIPVKLKVHYTEIGVLEIFLLSTVSDHCWKLEFQLRGANDEEPFERSKEVEETLDKKELLAVKQVVREAFSLGLQEKLKSLSTDLEHILQKTKNEWSVGLLRELFDQLKENAEKRKLSAFYESRFWNLAGFYLRPGFGFPLDDYRIKELWKWILEDGKKPIKEEAEIQKAIVYRRIAGGLKKGQQMQIWNELFASVYHMKKKSLVSLNKKDYGSIEKIRTLGSLELVDTSLKIKLGKALLDKICSGKAGVEEYWTLSRIGARELLHGSLADVIVPKVCEEWVFSLLESLSSHTEHLPFLLTQLCKKTKYPAVNISRACFEKVVSFFKEKNLSFEMIEEQVPYSQKQKERVFGDSLPIGISLIVD